MEGNHVQIRNAAQPQDLLKMVRFSDNKSSKKKKQLGAGSKGNVAARINADVEDSIQKKNKNDGVADSINNAGDKKKGFVENKVETSEEDVSESFGNNTANKNDAGPCVKKGKNGGPQTSGIGNGDPQLAGIRNGDPQLVGIGNGDPKVAGIGNGVPQRVGIGNGDPQVAGIGNGGPQHAGIGNGDPKVAGIGNGGPQFEGIGNGGPQPVGIEDGDPQPEGTNNSNVESSFQCGGLVDISEDGNLSPSLVHLLRDQYLDHLCSLFKEQRLITKRHVAMLSKADVESLSLSMGDRNMLRNLVAVLSSSLHEATSDSNRQSAVSTSTRSRSTSASSSSRNFVADGVFALPKTNMISQRQQGRSIADYYFTVHGKALLEFVNERVFICHICDSEKWRRCVTHSDVRKHAELKTHQRLLEKRRKEQLEGVGNAIDVDVGNVGKKQATLTDSYGPPVGSKRKPVEQTSEVSSKKNKGEHVDMELKKATKPGKPARLKDNSVEVEHDAKLKEATESDKSAQEKAHSSNVEHTTKVAEYERLMKELGELRRGLGLGSLA